MAEGVSLKHLPNNARNRNLVLNFLKSQPREHFQAWGYGEPTAKSVTDVISMNTLFGIVYQGELVGIIGFIYKSKYFIPLYSGQFWIHYIIDKSFVRKGIATAAVKYLLDIVKTQTPLNCIYAGIYSNNIGSRKVVEKAGFVKKGEKSGTSVYEKDLSVTTT